MGLFVPDELNAVLGQVERRVGAEPRPAAPPAPVVIRFTQGRTICTVAVAGATVGADTEILDVVESQAEFIHAHHEVADLAGEAIAPVAVGRRPSVKRQLPATDGCPRRPGNTQFVEAPAGVLSVTSSM